MENIFNKKFVDGFSSILDVTISEMAEKIMNELKEGKSYATYKSETWKNGKCTDQVEKEWEDGKLVKDEGFNSIENIEDTTPKMTEVRSCNCKCTNENSEKHCKGGNCKSNYSDEVNDYILSLETKIIDLQKENEKLRDDNAKLESVNIVLVDKVNLIKKMFE